ncbi:MAG TPA: carboxypeptidase regulatory-like domain-containing protein [Burkholderiaceae bacterium]|nr:carboxypeptidase regulatory-like domain-containing protein [Burkholderiaceae bacterium]
MNTIHNTNLSNAFKWLAISAAAASLVACGGGGSDSSISVTGTAATGAALSGANVTATCASGTGSATSGTDGTYNVSITNGKAPCVLVATKGATVLRSIAPAAGVANITPLTDMLVEYVATRAGTTPDNLLSNNNGKAIIGDTTALNQAQTGLVTLIKTNFNITISTTNFLTATITTPQGGTQSAGDKDLDVLKAAAVITSEGKPQTTVITAVKTEAQKTTPYVATTGASS